jgi:dTDP-4-amino-4,6-dideoxygalactose transaminase
MLDSGSGRDHVNIPQVNPSAAYRALAEDIDEAVRRVLVSGQYVLGQEVSSFESEFSRWLGAGHAAGCASGTDALALALRSFGIGPGSAVVTVSHTAVATVAAIEMVGATPLLIDIETDHFTLDPRELGAVLENPPPDLPPIRAVIPVHIYGQAADLGPILELCAARRLTVIEDCAQAHGASYLGRRVGTLGDAAAFSFYPTKNLGAIGDSGLVSFQDGEVAERARALRQYGWGQRFVSDEPGINSRMDEIQAAILRTKLIHLDRSNARREEIATAYDDALARLSVPPPLRRADCQHVFHQYVVRLGQRDSFRARLRESRIATGIHYPVPVHEQPAYANRVLLGPSACKATSVVAQEIVSLPMYPELTDGQVEQICAALKRALPGDAL